MSETDVSTRAADEDALAEVDCEGATERGDPEVEEQKGSVPTAISEDEVKEIEESVDESDDEAVGRRHGPNRFLQPGGGFGGSQAPIERAIAIARRNGLTVTSLKRSSGNPGSDHHTSQPQSYAADLSNGSSPTPEMDRTARQLAAALGRPGWTGGEILNVSGNGLRVQLIWRTSGHFNHVHIGCRRQ